MTFDIIIMCCSKTPELIAMTQNTITSLRESEFSVKFNVVLIESGEPTAYYGQDAIYLYKGDFNYNRACNLGLSLTNNKYVLLCNNDLEFTPGFAETINAFFHVGAMSVSPRCKYHHTDQRLKTIQLDGYNVGQQIVGWCIGINREILNYIGGFDESVSFWYSDHVYAEQIKRAGIAHYLVPTAIVNHLGSKTLDTLKPDEYFDLTVGQYHNYKKATEVTS